MPLTTGIRSTPITEMYTRCCAPASDAARTRFRVASSSPFLPPAQCTMIPAPSTAAWIPSSLSKSTGHILDTVRGLVGASAEHSYVAARFPQARDDVAPERACAAGDQDA